MDTCSREIDPRFELQELILASEHYWRVGDACCLFPVAPTPTADVPPVPTCCCGTWAFVQPCPIADRGLNDLRGFWLIMHWLKCCSLEISMHLDDKLEVYTIY